MLVSMCFARSMHNGDVHEGSSVQHAGSDYADIDALKMMDMQAELFLLLTTNELLHVQHQLLI